MRVSNVSTKEKRRYALDNLGGVDFSSSPLLCAPTRSPDAENWIGDHGINRKRHGWEQVVDVLKESYDSTKAGKINGIIPLPDKDRKQRVLVYAGTQLHLLSRPLDESAWSVKGVGTGGFDNRISYYRQGDTYYIIGAGSIITFDANDEVVVSFVDNVYVPTTTYNIGVVPNGEKDTPSKPVVLDPVNLLTARRKNALLGFSEFNQTGISTQYVIYELDGAIANRTDVVVTATVASGDGLETIVIKNDKSTNDATHAWNHLYIEREDNTREYCGVFSPGSGEKRANIRFYGRTFPQFNVGESNIVVEFTADVPNHGTYITNCTIGTLYGYGGAYDRLFLSGNADHPNVVFFSEENDFSYFPDLYTITLGGESDPAKGFLHLADSTLAVLCEKSIYYIGGEGRQEYDENGTFKRITPVFSRQAGSINEGVLNAFCAANFGGDNVFLSKHGLFGIEPTSNVLTNTRTARERSYAINARLNLLDPAKASIFAHGQRLYVSDGENCFVADSAYKYMPTGSESYNYEWWYWTHVPARVWAEVNGELWFGTADGRVCRFTDGYKDVTWDYTADGEITYKDAVSVIYNEKDKVGEIVNERRVRFTSAGTGTWADSVGSLTEVNLYAHITDSGLRFARYADATDAELITFTQNGQNPILRVYDDSPVVATWASPPLDLGNDSIAKTLFSLSVTAEAGQNSILKFGHETRRNSSEFDAVGLGKFDWSTFDFNEFTFETGFQNTYTVRAHDRNFNFIRFHLRSDGDRPCAVHRIAAIYKNNKYSKGVV